jgi:hypothetical protein
MVFPPVALTSGFPRVLLRPDPAVNKEWLSCNAASVRHPRDDLFSDAEQEDHLGLRLEGPEGKQGLDVSEEADSLIRRNAIGNATVPVTRLGPCWRSLDKEPAMAWLGRSIGVLRPWHAGREASENSGSLEGSWMK